MNRSLARLPSLRLSCQVLLALGITVFLLMPRSLLGATYVQFMLAPPTLAALQEKVKLADASAETTVGDDLESRDGQSLSVRSDPVPDWVARGSYVEGGIEYLVVESPEEFKKREAENQLWIEIVRQTGRKIDEVIGPGTARAIGLDREKITELELLVPGHRHTQEILTEVPKQYIADVDFTMQRSYKDYALIKLDDAFYAWSNETWQNELVQSRVLQSAIIGLVVLGSLALVFGYFQFDHRTRGFYSGRLQLVSLALLLILFALAVALSDSFQWL